MKVSIRDECYVFYYLLHAQALKIMRKHVCLFEYGHARTLFRENYVNCEGSENLGEAGVKYSRLPYARVYIILSCIDPVDGKIAKAV